MKLAAGRSVWLFLLIQLAAYAVFVYLDLARMGEGSAPVKYGAILLCLAFSWYWSGRGGERLVAAALTLTLAADTFLLLLGCWYGLGVALFCAVQGLYLRRIWKENGGHALWLLRLGLSALSLILLGALDLLTALNALALCYFSNFLCNVLQTLPLGGLRMGLFRLGLALFLCCDVCVGVFNAPGLFPAPLTVLARVGMWLFYLPGQVLIALSSLPEPILRGKENEDK